MTADHENEFRNKEESKPSTQPDVSKDNFLDLHEIPILDDFLEKIQLFTSYWKTRRAILLGERLYDFSKEKLRAKGYLNPFAFNMQQSFLSTFPSIAIFALLSFFNPVEVVIPSNLSPFWVNYYELRPNIEKFIFPVFVPLAATVETLIISWSTVRKEDINRLRLYRNARAYLYLDGAHGLVPQMLFSVSIPLILIFFYSPNVGFLILMMGVGLVWQLYLIYGSIPKQLFDIQGYSRDERPWERHFIIHFIAVIPGIAIWSLLVLFLLIIHFITLLMAWIHLMFGI